jgi:hypothetical protein
VDNFVENDTATFVQAGDKVYLSQRTSTFNTDFTPSNQSIGFFLAAKLSWLPFTLATRKNVHKSGLPATLPAELPGRQAPKRSLRLWA